MIRLSSLFFSLSLVLFLVCFLLYFFCSFSFEARTSARFVLNAETAENRNRERRQSRSRCRDEEKNSSRQRSESQNCINLFGGSSGLLGFAFTSSSTLRLRRQRDSLTLKAVSHPRREPVRFITRLHIATPNEMIRSSCDCIIPRGLEIYMYMTSPRERYLFRDFSYSLNGKKGRNSFISSYCQVE